MLHHLAVLNVPYLEKIISGRKTIECRLAKNPRLSLPQVQPGDLIWLKEVGGPVRAVARAREVRVFENLTPEGVDEIRQRFGSAIRASVDFWLKKRGANTATLIWLTAVCPLRPFRVPKRDRRAWVMLAGPPIPGQPLKPA